MFGRTSVVWLLLLWVPLFGCADDDAAGVDDSSSDDGDGGEMAAAAPAGTSTDGASAGPSATSQEPSLGELAMCDTSVASVDMCGEQICPGIDAIAEGTCTVNCCVDGQCGRKRVPLPGNALVVPSECALPIEDDDRCPAFSLGLITFAGCCVSDTNRCGFVDNTLSMSCVPRKSLADLVSMIPTIPGFSPSAMDADAGIPLPMMEADAGVDFDDPATNPLVDVACDGMPIAD